MHPVIDLAPVDADDGEIVDVEEAPVVDGVGRQAPVRQAIVLGL
jgi:hypothetical protein